MSHPHHRRTIGNLQPSQHPYRHARPTICRGLGSHPSLQTKHRFLINSRRDVFSSQTTRSQVPAGRRPNAPGRRHHPSPGTSGGGGREAHATYFTELPELCWFLFMKLALNTRAVIPSLLQQARLCSLPALWRPASTARSLLRHGLIAFAASPVAKPVASTGFRLLFVLH